MNTLKQMQKHTTAISLKSLSRFLQILDGSFPSGTFVHSFGLEAHILKQKVSNIKDLSIFLENLISFQYKKMEYVYIFKVYKYLANDKKNLLYKLDNKISSYLTYEYAKASKDIGQNIFKHIKNMANKDIVKEYFFKVLKKQCAGNELVILSAYAYDLEIPIEDFIIMWTKKNFINIANASLKISRIKPSEIQQMLFSFDEKLEKMNLNFEKEITNFNPLFEEIIFEHKTLEPKMFVT